MPMLSVHGPWSGEGPQPWFSTLAALDKAWALPVPSRSEYSGMGPGDDALAGSPADPQVQMRLGTTLPSVLGGWCNKHSCPRRPCDYVCGAQAPLAPCNFTGDKRMGEPWPLVGGPSSPVLPLVPRPSGYHPLSPVVREERARSHTHLPNKAPVSSRVSDWPTRFEDVLQP